MQIMIVRQGRCGGHPELDALVPAFSEERLF